MRFYPDRRSILVLVFTCCVFAATAYPQQIQVNKNNRTIAVTVTDNAETVADTAIVHIGFVVYAPDAKTAYAEGSKTSNAIAKNLMATGVAKTAVQSEAQNISETTPFELEKLPPAERAKKEFQVRQSWTVKTKAVDAAKVLNVAVNAGANQSGNIDWTVADENRLEAKAAGKALARARAIASQMAQGLGIQLGELIYASNQAPEPRAMMMRGMADGVMGGILGGMGGGMAPAPLSIQPHKVERSATVYAVFSIQ